MGWSRNVVICLSIFVSIIYIGESFLDSFVLEQNILIQNLKRDYATCQNEFIQLKDMNPISNWYYIIGAFLLILLIIKYKTYIDELELRRKVLENTNRSLKSKLNKITFHTDTMDYTRLQDDIEKLQHANQSLKNDALNLNAKYVAMQATNSQLEKKRHLVNEEIILYKKKISTEEDIREQKMQNLVDANCQLVNEISCMNNDLGTLSHQFSTNYAKIDRLQKTKKSLEQRNGKLTNEANKSKNQYNAQVNIISTLQKQIENLSADQTIRVAREKTYKSDIRLLNEEIKNSDINIQILTTAMSRDTDEPECGICMNKVYLIDVFDAILACMFMILLVALKTQMATLALSK